MKHYKGKEIKNEYFNLSMYDLEDGLSIDDLRNLLQEYENNEMYWECAGIQKAIDQMTFRILTLMSEKLSKQEIKLNYADTKEKTTRK
jgi:short-subunit dehydrogenase involved in D-alanine esterification of teichoic acids